MDYFDKYVNKVKPHAVAVGRRSEAYAQRIIARLDAIAEAVSRDDPDEITITRRLTVTAAGGPVDLLTVPPGQTYRLQGFAVRQVVAANATGAALFADGQFLTGAGIGVNGGFAVAPAEFIIRGGAALTTVVVADSCDLSIQFTVMRRKPVFNSHLAGNMEWEPYDGVPDPRQEAQNASRHAAPGVHAGARSNGSDRP